MVWERGRCGGCAQGLSGPSRLGYPPIAVAEWGTAQPSRECRYGAAWGGGWCSWRRVALHLGHATPRQRHHPCRLPYDPTISPPTPCRSNLSCVSCAAVHPARQVRDPRGEAVPRHHAAGRERQGHQLRGGALLRGQRPAVARVRQPGRHATGPAGLPLGRTLPVRPQGGTERHLCRRPQLPGAHVLGCDHR